MRTSPRNSILLVGLVVAVILLLAACGGEGQSSEAPAPAPAPPAAEPPATATEEPPAESAAAATEPELTTEPITLTVLDHLYFPDQPGEGTYASTGKGLQAVDAAFMKLYPNITIKHTPAPFEEQFAKLRAAVAAQEGPDVVQVYPGVFAATYRKGLLPLEDRLTDEQKQDLQFLDISVSPDGHLYALPWNAYAYEIVYNKKLFAQAGLDPENPPTTWDALLQACDTLNAAGITPIAAGWADGFYTSHWLTYVFITMLLSPDELLQWNRLELPMSSPKLEQATKYFLELSDRKCFTPYDTAIGRALYDDVQNDFGAGKAAMISWYDVLPDWQKTLGGENLGVMRYPMFPDSPHGEQIMDSGPNGGWAITNWSEHPNEAYAYLSFLVSPEGQQIMLDVSGENPNNVKVDTSHASQYPPKAQFYEWLKNPKNATSYMGYTADMDIEAYKNAVELLAGRMTIEEYWQKLEDLRLKNGPEVRGENG